MQVIKKGVFMRINKDCWLFHTPIAHRGLWGGQIQENSITAYLNAVKHGFAIEIDVYQSCDGELFSFHDAHLKRMTGVDGYIFEKSAEEIKSLRLNGSDEHIPTLKEVLDTVDGKAPLLIEFKDQPDKGYVKKAVELLKDYKGEFAVQSFNPLILNKIKKLAPQFLRGVLGTNDKTVDKRRHIRFIVSTMPLNFLIKPDFISYDYKGLDKIKRKTKGKILLAWTVTSPKIADTSLKFADNIIFEHFIPTQSDR